MRTGDEAAPFARPASKAGPFAEVLRKRTPEPAKAAHCASPVRRLEPATAEGERFSAGLKVGGMGTNRGRIRQRPCAERLAFGASRFAGVAMREGSENGHRPGKHTLSGEPDPAQCEPCARTWGVKWLKRGRPGRSTCRGAAFPKRASTCKKFR